jgi:5-methylcytosine-specific restriction endonuclease McrA
MSRPKSDGTKAEYRRRLLTRLLKKQGRRCALCFRTLDISDATLDHIIPHTLGGPRSSWNLQAAHRKCNAERGCKRLPGLNVTASLFERRLIWSA